MRADAAALVVGVGAALDLATKAWARASLEPYGPPIDFLPFVSLHLSFNEGVSFSMFDTGGQAGRVVLIGLTALLTVALGLSAYLSQGWQRAALSVILAGALSNLIDRTARGAVTDFLGLHFGDWYAFVFNLADVWISLGFLALLIAQASPTKTHSRTTTPRS